METCVEEGGLGGGSVTKSLSDRQTIINLPTAAGTQNRGTRDANAFQERTTISDKKHTIGDCKATVCGSPVSHRLEWRVMQLPSWLGTSNVRICHYCPFGVVSVTPLMAVSHW